MMVSASVYLQIVLKNELKLNMSNYILTFCEIPYLSHGFLSIAGTGPRQELVSIFKLHEGVNGENQSEDRNKVFGHFKRL